MQGAGGDDSPAAAAARALGADSVNITVDSVKNWWGWWYEAVERGVCCACWDLLYLAQPTRCWRQAPACGWHRAATALRAELMPSSTPGAFPNPLARRLTSPRRKGDVQMVGALVYKMLSFLEHETGGCAGWVALVGHEMGGA